MARPWNMKIQSATFSRCVLCVFFVCFWMRFPYHCVLYLRLIGTPCCFYIVILLILSSAALIFQFMILFLGRAATFFLKNKSELDMFNWSYLLCERSFMLQRSSIFSHYILNSRAAQLFFWKSICRAALFFWKTNQSLICSINSNAPICVFFHASTLNLIFIL